MAECLGTDSEQDHFQLSYSGGDVIWIMGSCYLCALEYLIKSGLEEMEA